VAAAAAATAGAAAAAVKPAPSPRREHGSPLELRALPNFLPPAKP
jgi:hypothetical protein